MSLQTPLPAPARLRQALLRRAAQQPVAMALRARRRGVWLSHSWSQLADEARGLAQAWSALGIARGDTIVALGPLSFDFIVTLFAADALGVTLNVAAPDSAAEAALVQQAQWAFVEGGHELERLLRHRTSSLRHVILAEADWVLDAQAIAGLALHSVDALLATHTTQGAPTAPLDEPILTSSGDRLHGGAHLSGHAEATSPWDLSGLGEHDRLLADFDTTWSAGLHFILQAWPITGSLLLIPEPLGDANADRRHARATVWLAPLSRLNTFSAELTHRLPSDGLAALVSQAALRGQSSPWAALARQRIKAVLGLQRLRRVLSEPGMPDALSAMLSALGIRSVRGSTGQKRPAEPSRTETLGAHPTREHLDSTLARSTP